jgi:mannose-1-phosphate guanylyltransferase/mannose-6-phosphate isomerase
VILCGGAGERLWPASRPDRPKPFLSLVEAHSPFQATVLRARPLAEDAELLVVGGAPHAGLIREQLAAVGAEALLLLEPEGRDTAAAIAAAAAWVAQRHPEAVLAILPADHHIPDGDAFRAGVGATLAAARDGGIVTLGLRPTSRSTAMGYIRPAAAREGPRPILAFVEKPDAARAGSLIAEGALWNSGIFVATARTLRTEMALHAAEVAAAVDRALHGVIVDEGAAALGPAFAEAPKVAFDRAVMEKTARGMVLPVSLVWSDLGAWDAVLAASARDASGNSLMGRAAASGSVEVLVRAAPGVAVVVADAERLAVAAEPGAVLVCSLDRAQEVRARSPAPEGRVRSAAGVEVAVVGADVAIVAAPDAVLVRGAVRRPLARPAPFATLAEAAAWFSGWLGGAALPLWATAGVDPASGGFREALTWAGAPHDPRRRARVSARQAFVFANAAAEGLIGPWAMVARDGWAWFAARARRGDGLYAAGLTTAGEVADPTPHLYEHAFILLALAALGEASEARAVLAGLEALRHPAGGFREAGEQPFQANAHMHLFEAALAWEAADGGAAWGALADEVAALALDRFIAPATGALREFYDAEWRALDGDDALVEPGHQFEWAWLLERWGRARGHDGARAAARRLFAVGRGASDPARGVVCNALRSDLGVRDAGARLWPQTEHLKAALILGETGAALEAANGLVAYLETPQAGAWRERMAADGSFLEEPSPATSLYHLYLAIRELAQGSRSDFAGKP